MSLESSVKTCPQCLTSIPPDAPQGLCPHCVLLGAMMSTDAGKPVSRNEPPELNALREAFPHLDILGLVGRGGMGFVYKARQAKLDRVVALKLLPMELSADPHFAERFNREARALARLSHPSIVSVYDFGVSGGFCYLLMEYVDGVNLRQAMQAGRFSQREALAIVPKICEAIQFAHEQGVLHRDIKPENILLDGQGRVKIADFGIAKLIGDDAPDLTLTQIGVRLGTPAYMAPEQIEKPGEVDHRADIYSLGVVFYELLTNELPLGRFAPPSAKAELDTRLDDIVMRALAKERELRQQSADEMRTDVETVVSTPQPSPLPPLSKISQGDEASGGWARQWLGSWLLVIAGVMGAYLVFVVAKTGLDITRGRTAFFAIDLLFLFFATFVALGCWGLWRRFNGLSILPDPLAPKLSERPFLFAGVTPVWKPLLLIGLGSAGVLFAGQALVKLPLLLGALLGLSRSDPLSQLLLLLLVCALVAGAWQVALRRRQVLHSLHLNVPEGAPAIDRWLGWSLVLLLVGLGGGMLIGLGSLLLILPPVLLVIIGLRAIRSRIASLPQIPKVVAAPPPAWMRRAAWWFLALGGIALMPTRLSWDSAASVWYRASLLVFTGLALLTVKRPLRRLAVVANWFGVFSSIGGSLVLVWSGRHEILDGISIGIPGLTTRPGAALVFSLLESAGFAAGLMVLNRPAVCAAFGEVPSRGVRRGLGWFAFAAFGIALMVLGFVQWKAMRSLDSTLLPTVVSETIVSPDQPAELRLVSENDVYALSSVTNQNGAILVIVQSPPNLGDVLIASRTRGQGLDAMVEGAGSTQMRMERNRGTFVSDTFFWFLPDSFDADLRNAAVVQIQQQLDRPFRLSPDIPRFLFIVTNAQGLTCSGAITRQRVDPETLQTEPMPVMLESLSASQGGVPALSFRAKVPVKMTLRARLEGAVGELGEGHTLRAIEPSNAHGSHSFRATWFLPEAFRGTGEIQAASQLSSLRQRAVTEPIALVVGKPITAFSLTNAVGEVCRGVLELVPPTRSSGTFQK